MSKSERTQRQPTPIERLLLGRAVGGRGVEIAPHGFASALTVGHFGGTESADEIIDSALDLHRKILARLLAAEAVTEPLWFYLTCPDNVLDVLAWVRPCRSADADGEMPRVLLTQPAAEGGVSFLGLVARDGSRLYWLAWDPGGPDLTLTLHGSLAWCRKMAEYLELPNPRYSSLRGERYGQEKGEI